MSLPETYCRDLTCDYLCDLSGGWIQHEVTKEHEGRTKDDVAATSNTTDARVGLPDSRIYWSMMSAAVPRQLYFPLPFVYLRAFRGFVLYPHTDAMSAVRLT